MILALWSRTWTHSSFGGFWFLNGSSVVSFCDIFKILILLFMISPLKFYLKSLYSLIDWVYDGSLFHQC